MRNYNTQQRKILLDFFRSHLDEYFSTSEIIGNLKEYDISNSAIYRNLSSLENDGKLKRISKNGDRKTYYQYIDSSTCKGHIHLSCIKCGITTHVSDRASEKLASVLKEYNSFTIDNDETVIYGLCKKCGGSSFVLNSKLFR